MNTFIDLANISKVLMDKHRYPSVQQEFERLFPSTTGGGRGGESRELSVGESSASTTTDTNTGFATPSTTKRIITEICG